MTLFRALNWLVKRYRATVINDIWFAVFIFSSWATAVQAITKYKYDLGISNQILTVLGTVLGLVISFRTSSAYERYQEGRKLWTSIQLVSRNLAIIIWVHVPTVRPVKDGETEDSSRNRSLEAIIEKKSYIGLVQAFSVSIKHALRGEPGVYWEDLYPLLSFLPRYAAQTGEGGNQEELPVWHRYGMALRTDSNGFTRNDSNTIRRKTFDPEALLADVTSKFELGPARSPPKTSVYDLLPLLIIFKPFVSLVTRIFTGHFAAEDKDRTLTGKRRKPAHIDSNVAMELSLFLNSYLAWLLKKNLLAPASATAFNNGLAAMQDAVANLDRVRNTPLPFAYQAHLRMCLWLYLLFLPFQLVNAYGWLVIPATAFAAFLMLGFLEIGQEIEDPFGYDLNDLPLDEICLAIQRELHEITAHPAPEPQDYIFSPHNQPFAPHDRTAASTLISDPHSRYNSSDTGIGSIYCTLLRNWREVNQCTRKS